MGRPMMPIPMNPTLLMVLSFAVRMKCWRQLERSKIGPDPPQTFERRLRRLVFAADPAGIVEFIDELEQERVIDLARTRLVAAGIVRELQVAAAADVGPEPPR